MTTIRILRDAQFSTLLLSLMEQEPRFAEALLGVARVNGEAVEAGTVITEATVDSIGKARYDHPVTGFPWYSAEGDYEVIS